MWFHEEVLSHRFAFSVMWMLLLQFLIVDGFHFLIKVISWHPWLGIQGWFYAIFSLRALCFHTLLCFTCTAFTILHMRYYAVERYVYSNRAEAIWTFISPRRVFHCLCLALLGTLNTYCYLGYLGGSVQSSNYLESIFLWESWPDFSFVIFHGLYAGLSYSGKYFSNDWYFVKFSLVQQPKLPKLGSEVTDILKESLRNNVRNLHWYYINYIIFGSHIVNWIMATFGFESSSGLSAALFNVLSVNLLLAAVISGTVMYFTWDLYICLFSMFASERYEFLIDATSEIDKPKVLCKAMTCSDFKLLQYLAFLDFRWLAQFSASRRKKIFAISQPGGHPHQWHSLSCICMTSLSQFLNNLKKLSIIEKGNGLKHHTASVDKTSLQNPVSACAEKVQDYFRKKPLFKYFFDDLPDTEAFRLFTSCQLEIWTIEALGFLIAASYTEDKFGVIQQTLPKILCLLIDLKVCEEKLPLGIMSFKKHAKDSKFLHKGVSQRHSLKSALESTLYRIVLTFKTDIRGVFIPEEYHRYLEKYSEFKK